MKKLKSFLLIAAAVVTVGGIALTSNASSTEKNEKSQTMTICHKGKTMQISTSAYHAHFSHGDMPGACN